ncbi:MAG: SpoIIE family protein phosphatase [Planctomycetota bacterium]|nr:SpoIIE family protein phosphatase [Planctomycetota bacterium]
MHDAHLEVGFSPGLAAAPSLQIAPILAQWPGTSPPTVRTRLVEALLADLESAPDDAPALPGAALIVLAPGTAPALVDRLVEGLSRRHLPALILIDPPDDWRLLQRHGVVFDSLGADHRVAAGILFALCERQGAVRLLTHEISLAQRCQGGMRTEMDRLHEELHLAAAIQREFTTGAIPDVPGLDISVLFRPVNFVSGDIYHLRDLGAGRAAFLVADAVGHGVPAALITMVLTSGLAMSDVDDAGRARPLQPADALAALNSRLCASCFGSGRFATAVCGVIDAPARRITLAGAGHPSPIVLSKTAPREIETSGPLLGVFGDASFDQVSIDLQDDETLLVYTDGLDAAFPEGLLRAPSGKARRQVWINELCELLTPHSRGGVAPLLAELQNLLDTQSGSLHQADDVTAVCIAPRRSAA